MEEFDGNDLDNLIERHLDEDINLNPEQDEDNRVPGENEEKKIVPVKIRVKKPQPKLNPER